MPPLACPIETLRRDADCHHMSGRFRFKTKKGQQMTFIWDGAAISKTGDVVLIEEELCSPVDIHIQGHLSRVAVMIAKGHRVRKLIWVTFPNQFRRLYNIVESWRQMLFECHQAITPPCDYLDQHGTLIAVSEEVESCR